MRRSGFSLIELVIVVVIVAILAAAAIPRMSRGASGAAEAALTRDLSVLRTALDVYQTENGGVYPTLDNMPTALLQYNDGGGANATYSPTPDSTHIYGPYLRSIPPLPVGARKGNVGINGGDGPGAGWIYTPSTGRIAANTTTETDSKGVYYFAY